VATGLNADRVDGLSAEQIIAQARSGGSVTCPSGTASFGGACAETAPRAAQDFQGASDACAADGRQLVATTQLISFRKRGGVTLNGSEMTSDIVISGNDPAYAVVSEQGAVATRALSTASPFRCVAPAVAPAAG